MLELQLVETLWFKEVKCGLGVGRFLVLEFPLAKSLSGGSDDVFDWIVVLKYLLVVATALICTPSFNFSRHFQKHLLHLTRHGTTHLLNILLQKPQIHPLLLHTPLALPFPAKQLQHTALQTESGHSQHAARWNHVEGGEVVGWGDKIRNIGEFVLFEIHKS